MGRSQRHMVIIQGTDACGKGLSEKQPALRYVNQFANSQAFSVWTGPAGGPLKGSTMVGFPPTLIPPPTGTFSLAADMQEGVGAGEFTDPGQFNMSGNPIYTDLPTTNEPGPVPPGDALTITGIEPPSGIVGEAVQITITGSGFTEDCVVYADTNQVVSAYVSDTEMTADLPSVMAPGEVTILVSSDAGMSNGVQFAFADAAQATDRSLPVGPINLVRVEDADTGIALYVPQGSDIQVGDVVTVEATGNTGVNGSYVVLSVSVDADEMAVVVDNDYTLTTPIEAKGRVTVMET